MESVKPPPPADGSSSEEQREHRRYERRESGTLWHQGVPFVFTLLNISAGGALVELSHAPRTGAHVELEVPSLGRVPAVVVHAADNQVGVRFEREIDSDSDRVLPFKAASA